MGPTSYSEVAEHEDVVAAANVALLSSCCFCQGTVAEKVGITNFKVNVLQRCLISIQMFEVTKLILLLFPNFLIEAASGINNFLTQRMIVINVEESRLNHQETWSNNFSITLAAQADHIKNTPHWCIAQAVKLLLFPLDYLAEYSQSNNSLLFQDELFILIRFHPFHQSCPFER